jgi:hypothetical protein
LREDRSADDMVGEAQMEVITKRRKKKKKKTQTSN